MLIIMLKINGLFSTLLENLSNFFHFSNHKLQKYFIAYVYY